MKKICLLLLLTIVSFSGYAQIPIVYYDCENSSRDDFDVSADMAINSASDITYTTSLGGCNTIGCTNAQGLTGAGIDVHGGVADGTAVAAGSWVGVAADPTTGAASYYQFNVSTAGFSGISLTFDTKYGNAAAPSKLGILISSSSGGPWTFVASSTTLNGNTIPVRSGNNVWTTNSISLPTAANNNGSLYIRIYGYGGTGATGGAAFMTLDNVTVFANSTVAGKVFTTMNENTYYTGYTSGGTGAVLARGSFTVTGSGTNATINSTSGLKLASGKTFSVTSSATTTFSSSGTINGTGAIFSIASGCTLVTANSGGIAGSVATTGTNVYTAGANYTFNGATAAPFPTGTFGNPGDVTISAGVGNTVSLNISPAINGNLTISSGILNTSASNFDINIKGNWLNNTSATAFVPNSGTVVFSGTSSQTIGGALSTVFNNLTINNSAGTILGRDETVNGTLTLTSGALSIGANNLILGPSAAPVAGSFSSSNMIIASGSGQVRKQFSANGSYLYPIGDNVGPNYTPITLSVSATAYSGSAYVGVKTVKAKHPNNANTNDYLNRYWTVTTSGLTSPSYSVTGATYVPGDVTGAEANISMGQYTGALPWIKFGPAVTATHTLSSSSVTSTSSDFTGITTALPTVSSSANTAICVGGSTILSASSGTGNPTLTYSWAPATGLSATTGTSVTASPTSTTTYTLTITDGNGFTGNATTTVSVNPVPALSNATNDGPVCVGGTIALHANGASNITGYTWTGPASVTNATSANATVPSATAGAVGVYTVTVNNGSGAGCTASYTTSATVNAKPAISGITASSSNLCAGTAFTLTAGIPSGSGTFVSYNWTGPNSFSTTTSSANTTFTPSDPSASGNYSLTVTYTGDGCTSNPAITSPAVTVNVLPAISNITPSATVLCVGTVLTLTGGSATGAGVPTSYNWAGPNGFNTTTSTNTVSVTPSSTSASGNYSVTVTYPGSGCTSANVVTSPAVTVNALPTVAAIIPSAANLCVGTPLTLTAGAVSGAGTLISYNWAGPNGYSATTATNSVTLTPTSIAASGNYTVSVTYDGTGCTSASAVTTVVTVNALPTVASIAASSNNLCVGTALTLTAGSTTGNGSIVSYNWSGPDSYTATTTGASVVLTPSAVASSGDYSVSVTYTGTGCTSNAVVTSPSVTVNALPTVADIIPSTTNICVGNTLSFSAGATAGAGSLTTYNWSGPNSYTATTTTNSTSFIPGTVAYSGDYSVTVTYTGDGCTSGAAVTVPSVTVNALPVVSAITPSTNNLCIGASLTLNASTASGAGILVSYNWAGPNGYAATSATNTTVFSPASTAFSGDYSVTVTYPGTGCTSAAVVTSPSVTVNALPAVSSTTASSYNLCVGAGLTLTAGAATGSGSLISYNWTGPNSYSATTTADNVTTTVNSMAASGDYSVSVTYTGSGCTSAMAVIPQSVTVNALPTISSITPSATNLCVGTPLTLTAGAAAGAGTFISYNWSGPNSFSVNTAADNTTFTTASVAESGDYSVTVTYTGTGCTSNAAITTPSVTVNALPTVAGVTPSATTICSGTLLTLTAGTTTGAGTPSSYAWSGPNSYAATTTADNTALTVTTADAGVYSLIVTYPGIGCISGTGVSPAITVNNKPTIAGITATPGILCAGNDIALMGSGATGTGSLVSYNWSGPQSYSSTTAGATQTYTAPDALASGMYSLTVTYPGAGCTSNAVASSPVTVNPLPVQYNVTGGGTYCSGGSGINVGLSNSEVGVNYQLYYGSSTLGSTVAGTGSALDFGLVTGAGSYSVRATNNTTGCEKGMNGSVAVSISVVPSDYNVTGGGNYCAGTGGVSIGLSSSDNGVSYQLYNGSTAIGSVVTGNGAPLNFGTFTADGTYTVVANPGSACAKTMLGSATVLTYPLPNVYNVTGGGITCAGSAGVHVGLDWSVSGVSYQLYNGATAIGSPVNGTSSVLDFGLITAAGTYTVVATNTTTLCTSNMAGSATITVNPAPLLYNVTGGGTACENSGAVSVGLDNAETGVNYQLYNGSSIVGSAIAGTTGIAVNFGSQNVSGTYTVLATNNTTSCSAAMTGSAIVNINPAPGAIAVTGGGSYCAGGAGQAVGLASSITGIDYQLYNGAVAIGSAVSGNGSAISFGAQTMAGTYTVMATNTATTCQGAMSGSAVVSINALPAAYAVTGGGSYCAGGSGLSVGVGQSEVGVNYQLYNGATATGGAVAGTGSAISFGIQSTAGTYTVLATNNTTACTNIMTGNAVITINALPAAYNVTGGGHYCSGSAGIAVGLDNSNTGINYQLYSGSSPIGSPVAGVDGSSITFGSQTAAGNYSVVATDIATTCHRNMVGSVNVAIDALPAVYTVLGGGSYCNGGTGVDININGSETGINYQLYNGATASGSAVPGTGSAISFPAQTTGGIYTVLATNTSTSCTSVMSGNAAVMVNSLPVAYNVTGGGTYCSGGDGVHIGLDFTATGINYQLYSGSSTIGSVVAGTGAAIDFGLATSAGTYTVLATNASTTCKNAMSGSAVVAVNPLPAAYNVTGGGAYCENGAGISVGVDNSENGVSYQLYNGSTAIGGSVAGSAGSAISFGSQTLAGTYTVSATDNATSCVNTMVGSAIISMNPAPAAYAVTGGGNICTGSSGAAIGLSNSATGINYQLYKGSTAIGGAIAGTGSAISFGLQSVAGTYTVLAANNTTACTNAMTGSAVIVVNVLPNAYTVTGGGSFCVGSTGIAVGLNNSQAGINYQLYNGATAMGSAVSGTGFAISFGVQSSGGVYTVLATNPATTCTKAMFGTAAVVANPLPAVYAVTGGGAYCAGGPGSHVGMATTATGVNYRLYAGTAAVATMPGTGSGIDFGPMATAGTYTALAIDAVTGCTAGMSGSASVSINSAPATFTVTGGGTTCINGSGVTIGLSGSVTGINYKLYKGTTQVGGDVSGTGAAISFGLQTVAGTYTVLAANATTGCTAGMAGSAVVNVIGAPNVYAVTGGGSFCPGGSGINISLTGSELYVLYQPYLGGIAVGSPVTGTGSTLNLGLESSVGTYTVLATNIATGCSIAMTGSASVSLFTLPTAYSVTGGGSYCSGSGAPSIGLGNSQSGVTYKLYNGASIAATVAGTGTGISFGSQAAAGTYTVQATDNLTGCTNNMLGSAVITINSLPSVYTVSGGGSYCAGGAGFNVTLSNSSTGVNYQLYNGSATVGSSLNGTGSLINFGIFTTAGVYTVRATNATTGCVNNMAGSATIIINPLPAVYGVNGGGAYCSGGSGVNVGLTGSDAGIAYRLFNGSVLVSGPAVSSGGALNFGLQTAAGVYTVSATNPVTGCMANMSASATVNINPLPNINTLTGGGSYCSGGTGVHVGLDGSVSGVNYQLYNGSTPIGSYFAGINAPLDFGLITATGTYTVKATDASTLCTSNMAGSKVISINPLPVVYNVTGGGSYCASGTGVNVVLSNSDVGVNYQLYNGSAAIGTPVAGNSSMIIFNSLTNAGVYSVAATNATTGCSVGMSGNATVNILPLPVTFNVSGGGNYCAGGAGLNIDLSGSALGINYRLYKDGVPYGSSLAGTGSALSFGAQTVAGVYSVQAINPVTNCSKFMNGTAVININPTPVAHNVTGGGSYCSGGSGVIIGVDGSASGSGYTLYRDGLSTGITIGGTGLPIDFGLQTVTGIYTVMATNSTTGCVAAMTGSSIVTISAPPFAYTVSGGGSYCTGGAGVSVILNGSAPGVNYQLYRGAIAVGSPVAGTGAPINFGLQPTAGHYTVIASDAVTTCFAMMTGSADVSITPLPAAFSVTGGGSFCSGGAGVPIGLNGSQNGVQYYLYNSSSVLAATAIGTGSTINFGMQTASGTYTVYASNPVSGCSNNMSGSAMVIANGQPLIFDVAGGGSYCSGSGGVHIGLTGSQAGVNYILYKDASVAHTPVSGTGADIDFGLVTATGNYSVSAVSTAGCVSDMSGSTFVAVNTLPAVFSMTGGGSYCTGGVGAMVGIDGSEAGVNYKLYRSGSLIGSPVAGTGGVISVLQTLPGLYTMVAENAATGCTRNMSGAVTISVNAAPAAYNISSGGSYCAGDAGLNVLLEGSEAGVSYQLYNGTAPVGSSVAGTGLSISFGPQSAGNYTVRATNTATGCVTGMTGSSTIVMNALPSVFTVTGGGSYCPGGTGVHIGLSGSQAGISYRLYLGSSPVGSAITGTGAALDFGLKTAVGNYSVLASNTTTSCIRNMTGSVTVSISALPVVFDITGGGSYCSGGNGMHIGLNGSQPGVNYQLYHDGIADGLSIPGTGSAIDFGLKAVAGSYSVVAANTTSACVNNMHGNAAVIVNALPPTHTVTGGGSYCPDATGVHIGLLGSDVGVNYRLYTGTSSGVTMPGNGSDLDFGLQSAVGSYSVVATDVSTTCTAVMTNSVTVSLYTLPASYSVMSSSSSYCAGGSGVAITLSGSAVGVGYQLYYNASADGVALNGNGGPLNFGPKTAPGIYTVVARNVTTNCAATMPGSPIISINPLPVQYTVTGGGSYCAGSAGVPVGIIASDMGVNYQLYNGSSMVGSAVPGNGGALNFGVQSAAGTYSVVAINTATLCSRLMAGTASVIVNSAPSVSSVTGGGSYCSGSGGVHVGVLSSSNTAQYQLYNGSATVGTPLAGVNGPLDFGVQSAAGVYTVRATSIANACASNMSGSATVIVSPLPVAFNVSGGGGYCSGGAGVHVGLAGSATGINYRLYNGSTPVGTPLTGSGTSIDFGLQAAADTYSVLATDPATTCARSMTGTATVSINALPDVNNVTGGGSYCSGTGGVHIGLSGSASGINYLLYNGSALAATVAGTGSSIDFGLHTSAGVYTVNAVNPATGCARSMAGTASISITPSVVPSVTVTSSIGTNICSGLLAVYTAVQTSGGTSPVYQWKVNGINVGFPTGSYTYFPADGDIVSVDLTSSVSCAIPATVSGSLVMTVHANVTPSVVDSVSPGDTVCSGTMVTLTAIPEFGGSAPAITWMKNGAAVGTGSTYSYVPADGDVVYSKMVSNYNCLAANNVMGNTVKLTVANPVAPSVAIVANPGTKVAPGQEVTLTAIISDGGNQPSYQWLINGVAVPGATNAVFANTYFISGDSVTCVVTNNSSCGSLVSFNTVVITISSDAVAAVNTGSIAANIFPNPNNGTFTIKGTIGMGSDDVMIEITDMLGQVVYRNKATVHNRILDEHITLDRSIASGMYIIDLQAGTERKIFHVIVRQ